MAEVSNPTFWLSASFVLLVIAEASTATRSSITDVIFILTQFVKNTKRNPVIDRIDNQENSGHGVQAWIRMNGWVV